MGPMKDPKPLEPLIPLDQLKSVVTGLLRVPKDALEKAEAEREKRASPKKKQP
jgi:hypothetical protein